jgi:hypothetical protein
LSSASRFASHLRGPPRKPSDVSFWSREARDDSTFDGIGAERRTDDGDRLRRLAGGVDCTRRRDDHIDLHVDQLGGEVRQELAIPVRGSILDRHGLARDVTELTQPREKGLALGRRRIGERRHDQISDAGHSWRRLCVHRGRSHEGANEERDGGEATIDH